MDLLPEVMETMEEVTAGILEGDGSQGSTTAATGVTSGCHARPGPKEGAPTCREPIRSVTEQKTVLDMGLDTIRIRAGAGTGKTTTVAMVIANLVRTNGVDPERILGITFTNKAASELADRVKAIPGTVEEGRQAEIHTYHGFAAQILAEFGALAGVDTGVKVITPTFSRQILSETYHHTT